MASKNLVILIGNVGGNPTIHTFNDGNKVANISLATTERYKDREGNPQETTTWHNVVVYGKSAEFVEKYIGKGRSVYVEGRIRQRKYTDSDGDDHVTMEIVADNIQPLDRGRDEQPQGSSGGWSSDMLRTKGNGGSRPQSKPIEAYEPNEEPDDLPF